MGKLLRDKRVIAALVALISAILAALGLQACAGGQLTPQAQRSVDTVQCYVAVLTPYVGDAIDVGELVSEAVQGRSDILRALTALGATREDLEAIELALASCRSPELFVRDFPEA